MKNDYEIESNYSEVVESNITDDESSTDGDSGKAIETVVCLDACDYVRNFGLTQCGCAG